MSDETKTVRLVSHEPSTSVRGTTELVAAANEHMFRFSALQFPPSVDPLAWATEQINAMSERDFAINCEHCPEEGLPLLAEEEAD